MKRVFFMTAFFSILLTALGAVESGTDFSRYSLILDRKPFGVPPAVETPGEGQPPPADSFATYVRLTALMQEEGGRVRVGFVDKKAKDKNYMLSVGEKADDYEVLEADVTAELAKVRKGTEEQWLSMKAPGAVTPPSKSAPKPLSVRPSVQVPSVPTNAARRTTRYAALRRAQLEREKMAEETRRLEIFRTPPDEEDEEDTVVGNPPPQVEEDEDDEDEVIIPVIQPDEDEEEDEDDEDQAIREAEIQQHLQNYQKELIKQDLPPLPIPLTPETDAELVKEGKLPPMTEEKDEDE